MSRSDAKRTAYGMVADQIEVLILRHDTETSIADWPAVRSALMQLHDKLQVKAEQDRIIPAMRLDDLEQLGMPPALPAGVEGHPITARGYDTWHELPPEEIWGRKGIEPDPADPDAEIAAHRDHMPDLPADIGTHDGGLLDAGLGSGEIDDFMDGAAR